jgi:hypothetical protein
MLSGLLLAMMTGTQMGLRMEHV